MKIWKEFNSSHSSNITIIGTFDDADNLEKGFPMIEDFTLASWEERYPSLKEFTVHWKGEFPNIEYLQIFDEEFDTGIDNEPEIVRTDTQIKISRFRHYNIGGIIKLLRHAGARKVTIEE